MIKTKINQTANNFVEIFDSAVDGCLKIANLHFNAVVCFAVIGLTARGIRHITK